MDKFYNEVSILKFLYKNHYNDNRIDFEIIETNGDDSYMNIVAKLDFILKYEYAIRNNNDRIVIKTRFKNHDIIITLMNRSPIKFWIDVYKNNVIYCPWHMERPKCDRLEIKYNPDEGLGVPYKYLTTSLSMFINVSSMSYFNEFIEYLDNSDILLNKIREYQKDYQGDSNDR